METTQLLPDLAGVSTAVLPVLGTIPTDRPTDQPHRMLRLTKRQGLIGVRPSGEVNSARSTETT
jgi:hypothetical protein